MYVSHHGSISLMEIKGMKSREFFMYYENLKKLNKNERKNN
jgi:hypothetical protein